MGISGRSLLKDTTLEEIEELIFDCYGRVVEIANKMGCTKKAIYELIEQYPELQAARIKASKRFLDMRIEAAEEVMDRLLDAVAENPDLAARQAQFILKHAKNSPYNPDSNRDSLGEERENADNLTKAMQEQTEQS